MGKLVNLDFKVFLVGQVQWVHQEIRDQWETKVQKVRQESQVHLVQEATQGKMVILEELDNQDLQVQQEREAYLEAQDQEVSRVCPVHQERMVLLGKMEKLACKDHLE